jgi:hypothetical protein
MHGGTLYIDAGKPTPAFLPTTLANLRERGEWSNPGAGLRFESGRLALRDHGQQHEVTLAKETGFGPRTASFRSPTGGW